MLMIITIPTIAAIVAIAAIHAIAAIIAIIAIVTIVAIATIPTKSTIATIATKSTIATIVAIVTIAAVYKRVTFFLRLLFRIIASIPLISIFVYPIIVYLFHVLVSPIVYANSACSSPVSRQSFKEGR